MPAPALEARTVQGLRWASVSFPANSTPPWLWSAQPAHEQNVALFFSSKSAKPPEWSSLKTQQDRCEWIKQHGHQTEYILAGSADFDLKQRNNREGGPDLGQAATLCKQAFREGGELLGLKLHEKKKMKKLRKRRCRGVATIKSATTPNNKQTHAHAHAKRIWVMGMMGFCTGFATFCLAQTVGKMAKNEWQIK